VARGEDMNEYIRSFISCDVEEKEVLTRIQQVQKLLVRTKADVKIVSPENIHITLRFLGNIHLNIIDQLYQELKNIYFTPFNVQIREVGTFPNLQRMRIIWVGIQQGTKELKKIFTQVEQKLQNLGINPEKKGFKPHITIARVKSGKRKAELSKCLMNLRDFDLGKLKANRIRIKKSVLTPKGPIYETLHEIIAKNET
jgi:2'-5' RNA ligase